MAVKFVPRDKFAEFIAGVSEGYELYGQQTEEGEQPHLVRARPEELSLGGARAVEPVKSLLFPPREDLGECFAEEGEPAAPAAALVGATAEPPRGFDGLHCAVRRLLLHVFRPVPPPRRRV